MNKEVFIKELEKLNIHLTDHQLNQLEKYYQLLIQWNQKINLTRITKREEVYLKHFYDSLTLTKIIDLTQNQTLCDVGTGAGFPGIVLKIVFPNLKITLIDSLLKRVKFLNHIINELSLTQIEAVHARAEDYYKQYKKKFDIVVSRAVANLSKLQNYCIDLIEEDGCFIAMKAHVEEELKIYKEQINNKTYIEKQLEFTLPIENSTRNLIKLKKNCHK